MQNKVYEIGLSCGLCTGNADFPLFGILRKRNGKQQSVITRITQKYSEHFYNIIKVSSKIKTNSGHTQ